ncbi:MAG: (d)CMP kinase [Neisseriaceae bacterium]|nr:(d)CMP kinase [Neisseriaceae bacterium]MBP6861570.1 (d)CMP kinase [Neisseriaceae bacterium]
MNIVQKVIAIDGPSASGKGTIAAKVAAKLGFDYLDSGALYRLTALYAQRQGVAHTDEAGVAKLALSLPVTFVEGQILLEGQDVTEVIRQEEIGLGASAVAKLPQVREALLARQRAFLGPNGLVADGRDMGSVVFPSAQLKIFLTASAEERAQRRVLQLQGKGQAADFDTILADIERRDEADRNRKVAPLKHEADAHYLDTSALGIEETLEKVLKWYQESKT